MARNIIAQQEGTAQVYGAHTRNRLRAILDDALGLLDGDKRRRDTDGRDVREALADAILRDPLGALERLHKLLPGAEPAGGILAGASIGALYLQAVSAAQPRAPVDIGELTEAGTTRVQPELSACNDW